MPKFSKSSLNKLSTCADDIRSLFQHVVKEYDCSILDGFRTAERQSELFRQGLSRRDGYAKKSKHQGDGLISYAVDVAPYPIPKDWGKSDVKELTKFYHFAGYVQGVAEELNIKIRWGGDWDGDKHFKDQRFDDLVHFELITE